jgi:hypothetical protein
MSPVLLCYALQAMAAAPATPATPQVEQVAKRRIFFGHQSVGGNVLDGLRDLGLTAITEARSPEAFTQPGVVHTLIGRNEDPAGKLVDFEKALDDVGGRPELALFKFCYIDFTPSTDVERLFKDYVAAHERLRTKHPTVTFVHVTVPLTTVQTGAKAWLKHLVGRAVWGEQENATRHRFNELLRAKYAGQPLYDLAAVEATRPDGTPQRFEHGGAQVPSLVPEYSDDGQHLNAEGRRRAAEALVETLAKLP